MVLLYLRLTKSPMAPNLAQYHGQDHARGPSRHWESSAHYHHDCQVVERRVPRSRHRIHRDESTCPYHHYLAECFSFPSRGQVERLDLGSDNDTLQISDRQNNQHMNCSDNTLYASHVLLVERPAPMPGTLDQRTPRSYSNRERCTIQGQVERANCDHCDLYY